MKKIIITTALVGSLLLTSLLYFNSFKLTYTSAEYPESTETLSNPYIGYYHVYGYVIKDEVAYATPKDVPNVPDVSDPETTATHSGRRLVLLQINLCRFKEQPLTDTALSQLDTVLSAWCSTDYSLLLRFIYDWDGNGLDAEPQDISIILQHMEQVASIYNKYADHILMLQGLFTGSYGEMHHTNYGSNEDMQKLAAKLVETAAPSIYLSVRTPNHWRSITGADNYEELASTPDNLFLNRLGLYNDGMFGSETDTGTYTRPRVEEIVFQDVLCQTVPNGGEVIVNNPYNDLDNAIADMKLMHVSYLNSAYDLSVIKKWQDTIYSGDNPDDPFNGMTGYEYIRNHLGYRFVLRSSEILRDYTRGQFLLRVAIENIGFSKSYRSFSFHLTLVNTETDETFPITCEEDSTCLVSGEITAVDVPLSAEDYPIGTYELYWQTVDDTFDEPILYGNDLPLTDQGYLLGTLSIERP